jgi:hypothetical protein
VGLGDPDQFHREYSQFNPASQAKYGALPWVCS